ncbi:hypothetical protein CVV38_00900 [Candidatus Peregrinibacteria bacterium HGW-Peregrinibacteria-1]|jgi:RNA polymerase sigma-70 factor (ECF subfamily)|nr:MAG: hypothetical protein CVV38_00900 [Candidatus Peregrinibacteria bacterium HGW-Peregrinibacteria-1]
MDFSAEKQIVYGLQQGDLTKFRMLFEDNFEGLYRFVLRRVGNHRLAEEITRMTFLDAIGQARNTPSDISFAVWLYSLAKPRIWNHISDNPEEGSRGRDQWNGKLTKVQEKTISDAEKVFGKLSLEEREILRLKFIEQAADGDVMMILGQEDETIGSKIYRVLKRAHFLMFGEETDPQGGYFSELSVFFEKLKDLEIDTLEGTEAFKINLGLDVEAKSKLKSEAVEAEFASEEKPKKTKMSENINLNVGSSDPAKIFVKAVEELREEEDERLAEEALRFERKERMLDLLDRFKVVLVLVPLLIFVLLLSWVLYVIFGPGGSLLERGVLVNCDVEVRGEMSDGERVALSRNFGQRFCEKFEVDSLLVVRNSEDEFSVDVELATGDSLDYELVFREGGWKIRDYRAVAVN